MKNEITYTEINGINYPNRCLPEQPKVNIGKYGQMRLDFLKKYRSRTYTTLLTEGRLNEYLHNIDEQAHEQINLLISQMAERFGVTEELKSTDPMRWMQEMNNIKASAEEIVLREVVLV